MPLFEQGLAGSKEELCFGKGAHFAALGRQSLLVENDMLWTIAVILIVLWVLGVVVHIGGGLIHLCW